MKQKVIKIGSSAGIIIPKSELKRLNVSVGEEIEVAFKSAGKVSQADTETLKIAEDILRRYHADFEALARK